MLPRVGGDLLGRVSPFQRVSGGTQLLLVAEGRHHRGQGLKDGRGVLDEEGAFLYEMGETGEGSGVIQMVLALEKNTEVTKQHQLEAPEGYCYGYNI